MEWSQFAILMVSFGGMWLWARSESRSDWRMMHQENLEERKRFDDRLCEIAERRNKFWK